MRFFLNYRKLNPISLRDSYPLLQIDKHIDPFGGAIFFSRLDCNSEYWQAQIAEQDRDKTILASHCSLYQFFSV